LDYRIYQAVNEFAVDFKWLAHATYYFETAGVALYGLAVLVLSLATAPGEERRWKLAALTGGATAAVSLLVNQLIGNLIWHRPRPYETHPQVYHLTHSHDPSFPSDHASAAFGIAAAVLFIDATVGAAFILLAALIAVGRVLIGAHYPGDVLAGAAVGIVSAAFVVFVARPVIAFLVRIAERATDPLTAPAWRRFARR
jgi:undecaprenyl-diphosphatase